MKDSLSRREWLGMASAAGLVSLLPSEAKAFDLRPQDELPKLNWAEYKPIPKPVTGVILGYGGRGSYYGWMATQFPAEWQIVGVAEPIDYRREAATQRHNLPAQNVFTTWEHVFDRPKFADVMVISTQDNMHLKPALRAMEMGYDLLLEKPIAQSWKECDAILKMAEKMGRIVAVCHVLRYAPYFMMMRELMRSGMIGSAKSVQHFEPVEHQHFSHSYCRGPWRNKKESTPIILAKSCHDLDILNFVIEKQVTHVSAIGGLSWFTKENAPEGAPSHCMDGCPVSTTCPYYAPDFYVHKGKWSTHHIISRDRSKEAILKQLEKGQYGRCVYHCDNDVPDHMIANLMYEGGVTASLHVEALYGHHGRRTRVFASKGHIDGDMNQMEIFDFTKERRYTWDASKAGVDLGGHGGGDVRLVRDFVRAVSAHDPGLLTSNLTNSMSSHKVGFLAEESRVKGGQLRKV